MGLGTYNVFYLLIALRYYTLYDLRYTLHAIRYTIMSTYKTEGIIIKRENFGEASLVLNVYTKEYGKLRAVARSARKAKGKLKGHLELFLDVELILAHGKNIDTIASSFTVENFSNLKNNLELSFGAYYILELVDRMTTENYKDEKVFYLLKKVFLLLDKLASVETRHCLVFVEYYLTILLFQIHLLNLAGFSPELNKCVVCSKPIKSGKNYFSFFLGGVVGNECVSQKEAERPIGRSASCVLISDNTIKLLRLFQFNGGDTKEYNTRLNKNFKIIDKLKVDEKLVLNAIFLMNKFIEFNIDKKIKGIEFFRDLGIMKES